MAHHQQLSWMTYPSDSIVWHLTRPLQTISCTSFITNQSKDPAVDCGTARRQHTGRCSTSPLQFGPVMFPLSLKNLSQPASWSAHNPGNAATGCLTAAAQDECQCQAADYGAHAELAGMC
jgi:hypothetical protein